MTRERPLEIRETYAREEEEEEELVTLVRPGGEKDVTLFTEAGPIRFLEGRARNVPLPLAEELARQPGWTVEP